MRLGLEARLGSAILEARAPALPANPEIPGIGETIELDELIAGLLTTFARLPSAAVDGAIVDAQRRVCALLGLEQSSLWQWVEGGTRHLAITHSHRPPAGPPQPERIDGEMLYPWVRREILAGRVVVISPASELKSEAAHDRAMARRFFGAGSMAVFPLVAGDATVLGALWFAGRQADLVLTAELVRRLRLVAQIFAAAIERQRAERAGFPARPAWNGVERRRGSEARADFSRRLMEAHEQARALLARELHDDVAQRLAVLAIDAGRAELAAREGELREILCKVRAGLVALSGDIHDLSYQLHPSILDDLGLCEAIEAECARFRRNHPALLSTELTAGPRNPGRDESLCLFRIAQEALHNVARHARARSVAVALRPSQNGWLLSVRDDGVGFESSSQRRRRSLGLASMRERVRLLDGRLEVRSAPGRGTEVAAWLPSKEVQA